MIYSIAARPMIIAPKKPVIWTDPAPLVDELAGAPAVLLAPADVVCAAEVVVEITVVEFTIEVEFKVATVAVLLAVKFPAFPPVGTVVKY